MDLIELKDYIEFELEFLEELLEELEFELNSARVTESTINANTINIGREISYTKGRIYSLKMVITTINEY